MNNKSIFAVVAGFATLMLTGISFYEVLLKSYFSKLMESMGDCFLKEPPILPFIVAHLCFAIILLLILRKNNVSTFMQGIQSSWIIVVLIMIWYEAWAFTYIPQMTISIALIDVLVNGTCSLLAAGVMGWVLGQYKN